MRLFSRKAVITVQTGKAVAGTAPALKVTCDKDGFDCSFEIRKDLTGKPNRGVIKIYNLTEDHRASLSKQAALGPVRTRLEVGYGDDVQRIFEGDLRILYHERDTGADFITVIESADGDRLVSTAQIFKAWAPGTPVQTVIKDIAAALDIGEGNVAASLPGALLQGMGNTFVGGTAAAGPAFKQLQKICKSSGLDVSIQDGTLQFLVTDQALSGTAAVVTPETGMEDFAKIDHKGRLHVKTRIIPNIFPGRKIQLADKSVWRVDKARYQGETRGHAWNIFIEAKPV